MSRTLFVLSLIAAGWLTVELCSQEAILDIKPAAGNRADSAADRLDADQREEMYELLMVLADTIDQIDRNYVEEISRRELLEAAIDGAMKKLDPYSNYIPPEELDEFKVEVENEFGGIGIQVSSQRNQLKVISPLVGSPAYRAGILAGDLILAIDGTPTKGMSIDDAIKLMKGRPGDGLTLTIFHPYQGETEDVELIREVVKVSTVLGDRRKEDDTWHFMLDPSTQIAYVRVTAFSRDTADDLRSVLSELKSQGLRGLILDLRFNPGGLLKSAIEVSDLFLSSGTIVSTEGRNIERQMWTARDEKTYEGFPMVVLVNQFSASASEIVAAALQDHQRAVVMGQQTFGKASVQNVIEVEDGRSALKITTGYYQRPSGKPIHRFPDAEHWGVTPNEGFEIALPNRQIGRLMQQRRQRDIVRPRDEPANSDDEAIDDPQLDRALSYLRDELAKSDDAKADDAKPQKSTSS